MGEKRRSRGWLPLSFYAFRRPGPPMRPNRCSSCADLRKRRIAARQGGREREGVGGSMTMVLKKGDGRGQRLGRNPCLGRPAKANRAPARPRGASNDERDCRNGCRVAIERRDSGGKSAYLRGEQRKRRGWGVCAPGSCPDRSPQDGTYALRPATLEDSFPKRTFVQSSRGV